MWGGSSEQFWLEKINGVGWVTYTIGVIILIFIWQLATSYATTFRFRLFFFRSLNSAAPLRPRNSINSAASSSSLSPLRISGIISDTDLRTLIDNLDDRPSGEIDKWDNLIDKRNSVLSYSAKCCKPKVTAEEDNPMKYVSVTVFEDCSAENLRDFYMDNNYRKQWDKTVIEQEQLQVDEINGIEIGRTIKKFPLLTPREYVIAWGLWEGADGTYYCFSKECEHPLAPRQKKYVRVRILRSGWRIRKGKLSA